MLNSYGIYKELAKPQQLNVHMEETTRKQLYANYKAATNHDTSGIYETLTQQMHTIICILQL